MSKTVTITMTEEQAYEIARVIELVSRLHAGQWDYNLYHEMLYNEKVKTLKLDFNSFYFNINNARQQIFPELTKDASYGVGMIKVADRLYEMYAWIRHAMWKARDDKNTGIHTVASSGPLRVTDQPEIKIEVKGV